MNIFKIINNIIKQGGTTPCSIIYIKVCLIICAVCLLIGLSSSVIADDQKRFIKKFLEVAGYYGLSPLYPVIEDVYVGDVFIVSPRITKNKNYTLIYVNSLLDRTNPYTFCESNCFLNSFKCYEYMRPITEKRTEENIPDVSGFLQGVFEGPESHYKKGDELPMIKSELESLRRLILADALTTATPAANTPATTPAAATTPADTSKTTTVNTSPTISSTNSCATTVTTIDSIAECITEAKTETPTDPNAPAKIIITNTSKPPPKATPANSPIKPVNAEAKPVKPKAKPVKPETKPSCTPQTVITTTSTTSTCSTTGSTNPLSQCEITCWDCAKNPCPYTFEAKNAAFPSIEIGKEWYSYINAFLPFRLLRLILMFEWHKSHYKLYHFPDVELVSFPFNKYKYLMPQYINKDNFLRITGGLSPTDVVKLACTLDYYTDQPACRAVTSSRKKSETKPYETLAVEFRIPFIIYYTKAVVIEDTKRKAMGLKGTIETTSRSGHLTNVSYSRSKEGVSLIRNFDTPVGIACKTLKYSFLFQNTYLGRFDTWDYVGQSNKVDKKQVW